MTLKEEMQNRGYSIEETGGGCQAYMKRTGDTFVLVCKADDPTLPESMDEPVQVGTYDLDWNLIRDVERFESLRAYLEKH